MTLIEFKDLYFGRINLCIDKTTEYGFIVKWKNTLKKCNRLPGYRHNLGIRGFVILLFKESWFLAALV